MYMNIILKYNRVKYSKVNTVRSAQFGYTRSTLVLPHVTDSYFNYVLLLVIITVITAT